MLQFGQVIIINKLSFKITSGALLHFLQLKKNGKFSGFI